MSLYLSRAQVRKRMEAVDWSFVRGSAIISAGMLGARVLGLGFSLVLASVFTPEEFGHVQYTLAVATILAIVVHPFGQHVIARFISSGPNKLKGAPSESSETTLTQSSDANKSPIADIEEILNHSWVLFLILLLITILISVFVVRLSADLGYELLFVILGIALFYAYWGLSRGYMRPGLLTVAYLGSNVVQLIAVGLLIWLLDIHSAGLALAIYGLSYVPTIFWLQWRYPLQLYCSLRIKQVRWVVMSQLIRFTVPITFSHGAFMLFVATDLLFLNRLVDVGSVGRYALAKKLASAFSFVPMGIATLLMPQIAGSHASKHTDLLVRSIAGTIVINLIFLFGFWFLVQWFVLTFFGAAYLAPMTLYLMLAMSAMLLGVQSIVAAVYVGSNQPQIETAGRTVATACVLIGCWWLVPLYGEMGAATSVLIGSVAALCTYALSALFWNGGRRSSGRKSSGRRSIGCEQS